MAIEQTLCIIKPDAVAKHHMGEIVSRFENSGLCIVAAKMLILSLDQVERVYGIHEGRPYYEDLCAFMTSGPVVILVIEGDDAISRNREIMGNTNPALAAPGTIRADFGTATNRNAVHGSDSRETAGYEIRYLFEPHEICSKNPVAAREHRYQSVGT